MEQILRQMVESGGEFEAHLVVKFDGVWLYRNHTRIWFPFTED